MREMVAPINTWKTKYETQMDMGATMKSGDYAHEKESGHDRTSTKFVRCTFVKVSSGVAFGSDRVRTATVQTC